MRSISPPADFEEWREIARALLSEEVPPQEILWNRVADEGLLFAEAPLMSEREPTFSVPKAFMKIAGTVACHRSGDQWALLYSLLWRLTHGEKYLLSLMADPQVHRVQGMLKQISRDCHKMHAFVRFRKVGVDAETGREQFVSWFEPDHKIVRINASFFRKRFANMAWSILTPDECMHWDGLEIHFTPGVDQSQAPDLDAVEELWKSYYKSIFNAARVKVSAMQSEMPKKYWKNLPEAELIDGLINESSGRVEEMMTRAPSPEKRAPVNDYLERLKKL
ncbi:TIGR03915 family putative DNA repair protein [Verrucomicrobiaceae bacterium 227]